MIKSVRHYWNSKTNSCDCGCKIRIQANGSWICKIKLEEELFRQGIRFVKEGD